MSTSAAVPVPPQAADDFMVPVAVSDRSISPHGDGTDAVQKDRRPSSKAISQPNLQRGRSYGARGSATMTRWASDGPRKLSATLKRNLDPRKRTVRRKMLGLFLLLIVVVIWTASQFLASSIFADTTYPKPWFVVYVNTCFFILPLLPLGLWRLVQKPATRFARRLFNLKPSIRYQRLDAPSGDLETTISNTESSHLLVSSSRPSSHRRASTKPTAVPLTTGQTFSLAFRFCFVWFVANYFNIACLIYSTVASTTILTSTSGMFTLIFGALIGIEPFTIRKLLGVAASLAGVVLISLLDATQGTGDSDHRGSFPYKSPAQLALGDAMALIGAVLYGAYATGLTKAVGDEGRVDMPLFFGFVGLINLLCLWPPLGLLHLAGVERFSMPPTGKVWAVILTNAAINVVADLCWAYAMLLTSPLVTTVGLSLTIPLSLIGQYILNAQESGPLYWLGAAVVVASFLFVTKESKTVNDGSGSGDDGDEDGKDDERED